MDDERKWFLKTESTPREDVVKTVVVNVIILLKFL